MLNQSRIGDMIRNQAGKQWAEVRALSSRWWTLTVPPGFGALDVSCWLVDLLRLWFFFLLPAALTERSNTPLALKKATRKGCLDWGPLLPTRPADFMLKLRPEKTHPSIRKRNKNWMFYQIITAFKCNSEPVNCSLVDLGSFLVREQQKTTEKSWLKRFFLSFFFLQNLKKKRECFWTVSELLCDLL